MIRIIPPKDLFSDTLGRLAPFDVEIAHPDEVEEYLMAHPELGSAIVGIAARLREVFGPSDELALERYQDPEDQDRFLALYVRQRQYEAGILRRIEVVASEFSAALESSSGHLLVTTDFRCPRV